MLQYSLDTAGRVSGVAGTMAGASTPYVSGMSYNAASAPLTIPFNNGVTETHAWNDRLQHTGVSAGNLLSLNFYPCDQGLTQCASGNNGKIWRQNISVGGAFKASQEYRYDAVNRLYAVGEQTTTGFSPSCSDTSAVWSQQFNYDAAGNRTVSCRSGNAISPPWEVSSISASSNKILDTGWTYDAAGNIIVSPYAPSITYDAENRQVAFCSQLSQGTCTPAGLTQYVYDGSGQRVQKVTSSGTVTYLYDAFGNLAAEYGGTPSAYGTQYVTGDHLTSTRLVMPGSASQVVSGTGIERHDYYPFGYEPAYGTGTDWRTAAMGYGPSTIRQKFTGQERDSESTLDFFQARYYSGPQGRFASVDPGNAGASLMNPQSWNGYSYVSNGPMTYTDPDGLGFLSNLENFALNLGLDFLTAGAVQVGSPVGGLGGGIGGGGGVFGGGANGPFVFNATIATATTNGAAFSNWPTSSLGLGAGVPPNEAHRLTDLTLSAFFHQPSGYKTLDCAGWTAVSLSLPQTRQNVREYGGYIYLHKPGCHIFVQFACTGQLHFNSLIGFLRANDTVWHNACWLVSYPPVRSGL
jgi:RHS repeat-associated protein